MGDNLLHFRCQDYKCPLNNICTERVNDLFRLAAADMYIPTFTVKKKTNPPMITKEILNKIKKKKKVMEKTKGSSIRNR